MRKGLLVAATVIAIGVAGCMDNGAAARRAIESYGFTDVKLGGTAWLQCSESDSIAYNTTFTAKDARGRPVSGAACAGMLKGWTVRID